MNYLIIGSGGREHCIAWKLANENLSSKIFVAPGNGGIEKKFCIEWCQTPSATDNDFNEIANFCIEKKIDLVIVGPEQPLSFGIVDFLDSKKIPVFGPTAAAAKLESSKIYAKEIMKKCKVPTAEHIEFIGKNEIRRYIDSINKYPIVIKLDGLASGKGVSIPSNKNEALSFIEENISENTRVFIEDFIDGEEASVLGISDGNTVLPFIAAQDHKRAYDGDNGPNTGGMGAYAPAPVMNEYRLERVRKEILQPVIDGMKKEGYSFKGILYAGCIIKGDNIKVLEFNVRFGDPETQVLLPLMDSNLGKLLNAAAHGSIDSEKLTFKKAHAITVVMASGGYPGKYKTGMEITGIKDLDSNLLIFHAGTKNENGRILTNGGRVLNVTAIADSLSGASEIVYNAIKNIKFDGAFYRNDIGYRAL